MWIFSPRRNSIASPWSPCSGTTSSSSMSTRKSSSSTSTPFPSSEITDSAVDLRRSWSYYAIFVFFLFYRSGLLRLGLPRFSVSRLQARKTFSGGTQLISEHSVHPYSQTVIILPSTFSLYSYNKLAVADTAQLSPIQTKYFQIFTILLCRQHYTICIIKFTPQKSKIIIKL